MRINKWKSFRLQNHHRIVKQSANTYYSKHNSHVHHSELEISQKSTHYNCSQNNLVDNNVKEIQEQQVTIYHNYRGTESSGEKYLLVNIHKN